MATVTIHPARTASGAARVPGDKSISHRYAILAALADGTTEITGYSAAEDCARTLECLKRLGCEVERRGEALRITGRGLRGLIRPRRALDAGNSGTTIRLLAGVLAGQGFASKITGDESLRRRPMRRVIAPLTEMGATIGARQGEFPPLEIRGAPLRAVDFTPSVPSAQVKSAVLLAGLLAEGTTSVTEGVRTRDHTELALAEFGAQVITDGRSVRVTGGRNLMPQKLTVPGDLSAAMFLAGAALVLPASSVLVSGVGLNPTRTAVLDFLAQMGAPVSLVSLAMRHGELAGDLVVHHAALEGGAVCGPAAAQMIDELPLLAALGPYTEKGIEIRDARELRVKESDRIAALAAALRAMGATVAEYEDGLRVEGRAAGRLRGGEADSRGDHRIAMACAVAALGAEGPTRIRGAECAGVSFPGFFGILEKLVERG